MIDRPPPAPGPVGVYVHFPFCSVRCTYCDFPTVAGRDASIERYLAALERELGEHRPELPRDADTVYLGGGTPSRMTPAQVGRVLDAVRARFDLRAGAEVTLEANPESVTADGLAGWVEAGVTRVSIGVQSLDDGVLRRVGRAHDAARALLALRQARATPGLEVNADLIAALPGESLARWGDTARAIADAGTDHVSMYLLETDKDTPLARALRAGRVAIADDDAQAAAWEQAVEAFEAAGLRAYEISNFARDGRVSRHNLKYWSDDWYGGFGLGAHGYAEGRRRGNLRGLDAWIEAVEAGRDPVGEDDPWDPARRAEEALILGLRRAAGVDLDGLGRRYGVDLAARFATVWRRHERSGALERDGTRVRLTRDGRLGSNAVFVDLIGELHPDD